MDKQIELSIKVTVKKDTVGYHSYCPDLKGVHSYGDTEKEAFENAIEAAILMIQCMIEDGDTITAAIS